MSARPAASSQRINNVLSDPLTALLLWGVLLTGKIDAGICALLGLREVDLAALENAYAVQLLELRTLRCSEANFDAAELGRMAMVRIGSLFLAAGEDEERINRAARALARLPLWVRDPELDALEREARREEATTRIIEARSRRGAVAPPAVAESHLGTGGVTPPTSPAQRQAPPPVDRKSPKTAVLVTDSTAQVKSESAELAKTAVLVSDSTPQVKSPATRKPQRAAKPARNPRKLAAQRR